MHNHPYLSPALIAAILSLSILSLPAFGRTIEEDFESAALDDAPGGEWTAMRVTDTQQVSVTQDASASSAEKPASKILHLTDQDDSEGLFGPALRHPLLAAPVEISFHVMLGDGREFPSVVVSSSNEPLFHLVLSDSGRTRQLAYMKGSTIEPLDFTMELNTWYKITLTFQDQVQLQVQAVGGEESVFEIPLESGSLATARHLDLLLSGSSKGIHGDVYFDDIHIVTDTGM